MDVSPSAKQLHINKLMAERVGFEFALERKFKNMQRTGCAFYACKAMVGFLIVVWAGKSNTSP